MRASSPSKSHCSQVPIKVSHQIAKKKAIRRKRIDLDCGCSFYLHIDCALNGFAHRGTHHCGSSAEFRLLLDDTQSPVLQNNRPRGTALLVPPRHNINSNPVQPQPEEGTGDSQVFSELQSLDDLTSSDWSFLKSL
ncbi:AC2 [Telfairia golden mosaic virus]|uniref:Transcriptional activator protein n=2 Tax=Viruses TaxID=10239 RepID=A0A191Z3Z5_9GEMI|nr:AC2 [Telfairia golden mosaic virus]ALO02624.1 AC2 [Telfairia golden mosaic virus]ANJ60521.1 AC2 [Telfairia mosaic virus]ANJ60527.1 AC2 [Telfairia mosaic virus]